MDRGCIARQLIDELSQFPNQDLGSRRQVVCLANPTVQRTRNQPATDVVDENEVTTSSAFILQRQSMLVKGLPDEGRRHISPHRGRRTSPRTRTKNLAGSVHILEPCFHEWQSMASKK